MIEGNLDEDNSFINNKFSLIFLHYVVYNILHYRDFYFVIYCFILNTVFEYHVNLIDHIFPIDIEVPKRRYCNQVVSAAFSSLNSQFRDEKLASLDRKSHRSNPSSVTQPGTRRSRGHVSEPPSLNPFTTLCPYYNPATTCCCLESSKSPFARFRISNSRTAGTGSQSLPVLLIKTLPII